MNTLALFDFDGTLTRKDSFIDLIKFYKGNVLFWIGMLWLSPRLVLFKIGLIPNYRAKESVLKFFFGGLSLDKFQKTCDEYAKKQLPEIVRKEALKKLLYHRAAGHRVIVVSASAQSWLIAWCHFHSLELIATRLEVVNQKITGKIEGKNCYGQEKVNRIKDYLNLSDYDEIYAYGDSRGDHEMIQLSTHPFYRKF